MQFGTAIELPYNREDRDSIFHRISCQEEETLSNIIKALGWGNNRQIRNSGFRLSHSTAVFDHPDYDAIGELKYNRTKNPFFRFKKGRTYISPKHGRTMAVVIIN